MCAALHTNNLSSPASADGPPASGFCRESINLWSLCVRYAVSRVRWAPFASARKFVAAALANASGCALIAIALVTCSVAVADELMVFWEMSSPATRSAAPIHHNCLALAAVRAASSCNVHLAAKAKTSRRPSRLTWHKIERLRRLPVLGRLVRQSQSHRHRMFH